MNTGMEINSIPLLKTVLEALLAWLKVRKKADDVWKELPWKKFRRQVFRLQRAIFKAQKNGNKAKVKRDALTTIA